MFWALRAVLAASGVVGLCFAWRWGVVLLFSLAAELFTFLWMALPLFSLTVEMLLMLVVSAAVGATISVGRKPLPPWTTATGAAAILLALRGSYYALGLADGTITLDATKATWPASVGLSTATGAGLLLGGLAVATLRRRRPKGL